MKESEKTIPATASSRRPKKTLKNGDVPYKVVSEYTATTFRFNPQKIKSLLREMIIDLFDEARKRSHTPDVITFLPEVRYLIETKRENVGGLRWGEESEEEIQKEIDFYTKDAYRKFSAGIEERLLHGPLIYIIETVVGTVGSLNKEGALLTKSGTALFYKKFFDALMRKFKIRWDMPGSGGSKLAGERKRALLLDYYETLMIIAKAKKNADSRRVNEEWQEAARKAATKVDPAVVKKVDKGVRQGTSPGNIAWQIASKKYLPKNKNHNQRILTDARNERKERDKLKGSK